MPEIITRDEAVARGLTRYFVGQKCCHGHVSERTVSSRNCIECLRLSSIRRRAADPEKKRQETADWRARNPEKKKAANRAWAAANPHKSRFYRRKRRAQARGAGGAHTAEQVEALYEAQKRRCANPECRRALRGRYEADHIVPLSRGGSNDIRNIQLLCRTCNRSKWHKDPIAWAQENGRLL